MLNKALRVQINKKENFSFEGHLRFLYAPEKGIGFVRIDSLKYYFFFWNALKTFLEIR